MDDNAQNSNDQTSIVDDVHSNTSNINLNGMPSSSEYFPSIGTIELNSQQETEPAIEQETFIPLEALTKPEVIKQVEEINNDQEPTLEQVATLAPADNPQGKIIDKTNEVVVIHPTHASETLTTLAAEEEKEFIEKVKETHERK